MAITISLTLDKIYQLWVGGNICLLSFSYDRCLSMATTIDKIYQLWVRGGNGRLNFTYDRCLSVLLLPVLLWLYMWRIKALFT